MTKQEKRAEIQAACTKAIIDNQFHGVVHVAPRVGKCKISIDALNEIKESISLLITYPENSIKESWLSEIEKWGLRDNVKVKFINQVSLSKEKALHDYYIIDECHTLSPHQIRTLAKIDRRKIMLSGSLSEATIKAFKSNSLVSNIIFNYDIEQAINDKIIADYRIHLVPCMLDHIDKYVEAKVGGKLVSEVDAYKWFTNNYERFKMLSFSNPRLNNVKMQWAGKRANFIYTSESKIQAAKEVIESLGSDRALIFTARTAVADSLADSYHSKSEENNLLKFKSGELDKMSICQMANMGVTIDNLKIGVFHQLMSNEESAVQKMMRMCNFDDDRTADIYITYYANTIDNEWLNKAISMFDLSKVKMYGVKQRIA